MRIFLLAVLLGGSAAAQFVPNRYVVELDEAPLGALARSGGATAAIAARTARIAQSQRVAQVAIEQRNGRVMTNLRNVSNALVVDIADADSASLSQIAGVTKVYRLPQFYPDLDHALPLHRIPQAWTRIGGANKAGLGVKIGIIDTGITTSHPGFQDPSLTVPTGYPILSGVENQPFVNNKIIVARSYAKLYGATGTVTVEDREGHGTAVAMCAAGVQNTGPLGTITGAAPKAFLGIYKVATPSGNLSTEAILKAIDDTLSDGMDVINMSFGNSVAEQGSYFSYIINRAVQFGMVVVVSAGNDGPRQNSLGDQATSASAITVGSMQNDRSFGGSVSLNGGAPLYGTSGSYPDIKPSASGIVVDVAAIDGKGDACLALPDSSLVGRVALVQRGSCTFEIKLNNASVAGASSVILYAVATNPEPINFFVGAATLPAVMLNNKDGLSVKAAVAAGTATVSIVFQGFSVPKDPRVLSSFSSRGPTLNYGLKPDLLAVGDSVYTAAQKINPGGEVYDATGYVDAAGTSFSSPIVAGAVAVLKGARPGLTSLQYRSLIVNSATPMFRPDGSPEKVQQSGSGIMNLESAVQSTIAVYPTSLSAGLGTGTLQDSFPLTLTNVGTIPETYTVRAVPYDVAPVPTFASDVFGTLGSNANLQVTIAPKQTMTVYQLLNYSKLAAGEYQGQILIRSEVTGSTAAVPYWYGVPVGVPVSADKVVDLPAQGLINSSYDALFQVTDSIGVAVLSNKALALKLSVSPADAKIVGISPTSFNQNVLNLQVKLSATPGANTFVVQVASLPPLKFSIQGVKQGGGNVIVPGPASRMGFVRE